MDGVRVEGWHGIDVAGQEDGGLALRAGVGEEVVAGKRVGRGRGEGGEGNWVDGLEFDGVVEGFEVVFEVETYCVLIAGDGGDVDEGFVEGEGRGGIEEGV